MPNYPADWTEDEIRAHERFCAEMAECEDAYEAYAAERERIEARDLPSIRFDPEFSA
jgi:hypothetical protein